MSSNKLLDFENTCGAYPLVFSCPEDSSFFYKRKKEGEEVMFKEHQKKGGKQ